MGCYKLFDLLGTTSPSLPSLNSLILMKLHNLVKVQEREESSDSSDGSNEFYDDRPELENINISHNGGVNRLRHANIPEKCIVSTWSDLGVVNIYQLDKHFAAVEASVSGPTDERIKCDPIFSFAGHQSEGFAMDWSRNIPGRLLTGDCKKNIHLWHPVETGWNIDQRAYTAHTKSVEDIQWSPNEATVFASCSCDGTIRVWDIRALPSKACMLTTQAHEVDVNVISWNKHQPLVISGGDDGIVKVWDLRSIREGGKSAALFKQHSGPITSVEWHPVDSPVFAASGEDNQVTQWDLSVERDVTGDADANQEEDASTPPQLLFVHKGQKQIKEVHWHPQLPGVMVSTAETGFNIFKTISV